MNRKSILGDINLRSFLRNHFRRQAPINSNWKGTPSMALRSLSINIWPNLQSWMKPKCGRRLHLNTGLCSKYKTRIIFEIMTNSQVFASSPVHSMVLEVSNKTWAPISPLEQTWWLKFGLTSLRLYSKNQIFISLGKKKTYLFIKPKIEET
jgi:hypothetical protein